jgi:hypothetical protein
MAASGCMTVSAAIMYVVVQVKLGVGLDRVRLVLTGSAPIADHVLEFLRIVFGYV